MSWSISRAFRVLQRHYSSQITPEARRKWGLSGLPSPRSILNDDDTPLPPSLSLSESSSPFSHSEKEEDPSDARRNPLTPPLHLRKPPTEPTPTEWVTHRHTLKKSFPNGWSPPRKLSRSAMDGLRELHSMDPEKFTTPFLAERFRVSPEAVRRILRSKWEPSEERRFKWLEKAQREREEKAERKRRVFEAEIEETRSIMEGRRFGGGLELRETRQSPPRTRQRRY